MTWLVNGLVGIFILVLLSGCSYGTYNATGSYPHQNNSQHGCEKERG